MPLPDLIQTLKKRVRDCGDLPVLRNTALLVLRASEDRVSGARDVARIIIQDEGFAVKVLRVVNSALYSHPMGEISSISTAVTVLGLDTIRDISLSLSFVELFEKNHPKVDLKKIIAGTLTAATLAQEFAEDLHHPDADQVFTTAILYNLGPISLAYYLPEEHIKIQNLMETLGLPASEAEQRILGTSMNQIGIAMAKESNIPRDLVESLVDTEEIGSSPARTPQEQIKAISYLANRITSNLFSDEGTKDELDAIFEKCKVSLNIGSEKGFRVVRKAYNKVKKLSESFGVEIEKFRPSATIPESETPSRRDLLGSLRRTFETYENAEEEEEEEKVRTTQNPDPEECKTSSTEELENQPSLEPHENDTNKDSLQLKFLRDISSHLYRDKRY
ncbi:MAG: HDOD domain-containing protein [Nitrospira sp.]|nr:HDOD domain-containing protein [Candidatus Manganitrophaceae bacterium]HIL33853.1 HDOD domain-containing protein [Candidatus Manganitrophaceae bacterium]